MHLSNQIWLDSDHIQCFQSLVGLERKHFIALEDFSIKTPTGFFRYGISKQICLEKNFYFENDIINWLLSCFFSPVLIIIG